MNFKQIDIGGDIFGLNVLKPAPQHIDIRRQSSLVAVPFLCTTIKAVKKQQQQKQQQRQKPTPHHQRHKTEIRTTTTTTAVTTTTKKKNSNRKAEKQNR